MNMNNVTVAGHIVRDVEVKETKSGKKYAAFSVAVNGPKEGAVEYINCSTWGALAEAAGTLKKGAAVIVVGRWTTTRFTVGEKEYHGAAVTAYDIGVSLPRPKAEPKEN